MRCLDRDKQWVLVSFFVEKVACKDDKGRLTGKHEVIRTEPIPLLCSVSASKGTAENSPFGIDLDYDKTVIIEDVDYPIDESSVLWVDNFQCSGPDPSDGQEDDVDDGFSQVLTDKPHDYTVKRITKSPNCLAVAIKRVEVGASDTVSSKADERIHQSAYR